MFTENILHERKQKDTVKRKVAVVIPKYGLLGGAEGFAAALTENLARNRSLEFHVFANRHQKGKDKEQIHFHHVPILPFPRFLKTPSFAFFSQRAVARTGVDVIHAHDRLYRPDLYTLHGIPHRIWVREIRKKHHLSLFDRATARVEERMVAGGCRYFLAVSHLTRDIFLREYPLDPEYVPVVPPGVDSDAVTGRGNEAERRALRRRFGISATSPLIVFAAMNFDIKGLEDLLQGLGRLRTRHPEQSFHLLAVGGDNRRPYMQAAARAGIGDRVTFTGAVPREELAAIYAAGDLYAMLSKFDTFGMVVLEAMAKGLPAVISGTVGARDLIKNGVNGYVIETPRDADMVAEVLFQSLRSERHPLLSNAAMATAREYSWEKTAGKVAAIYESIIASKRIPPPTAP